MRESLTTGLGHALPSCTCLTFEAPNLLSGIPRHRCHGIRIKDDGNNPTELDKLPRHNKHCRQYHGCAADGGKCIETVAGYNCTCMDGYVGDGFYCTKVEAKSLFGGGLVLADTGALESAVGFVGGGFSFLTTTLMSWTVTYTYSFSYSYSYGMSGA